jgi:ABC-type cobalamin/Fe3+-siderophores transport system ATPase subunit
MEIHVDISIDFLWGKQNFVKNEWGNITYIVGANGTGKTQFAERLKNVFKSKGLDVRYFGAERMAGLNCKTDGSGYFGSDNLSRGLNISHYTAYKQKSDELGYALDAIVELKTKLDLRVKIEAVLSEVFKRQIIFKEEGGYLKTSISRIDNDRNYDLKANECHGLKELISLLAFIYDDQYNCLILDEPELHLHPQYQQFILSEIRKMAGNPFEDKDKKMFVILTHSPTMIDIRTLEDLKNYIVFQPKKLPAYIDSFSNDDPYDIDKLNKLLPRLNSNHKLMFFAKSPIFVEGYTDQQIFNLIQEIRDVNMGANGISIIDVGGKDEVDMMYRLCGKFNMDSKAILDSDCLFGGKIRQTISKLPETKALLASKGISDLMKEIGEMDRKIQELILVIESKIEQDFLDAGELKDYYKALLSQNGPNALLMKKRLTYMAVNRETNKLKEIVGKDKQTLVDLINGKSKNILTIFEKLGVYILSKGEMENYYKTYCLNQYIVEDGQKTNVFIRERDYLFDHFSKSQVESDYPDIVEILDKICTVNSIDIYKYLSATIGDWIHLLQKALNLSNDNIEINKIKMNPIIQWEVYNRLFDIILLEPDKDNYFKCIIKLRKIIDSSERELVFYGNTVAANYKI